jgi:hypothetical protein
MYFFNVTFTVCHFSMYMYYQQLTTLFYQCFCSTHFGVFCTPSSGAFLHTRFPVHHKYLNLFISSDLSLIHCGRQLNIFVPEKWTPLWDFVKFNNAGWRSELCLVLMECISEFVLNNSLFLATNGNNEKRYCDFNGSI